MAEKTAKRRRKINRISYQDFRSAVTAEACCAGDGTDTTTTLATLIVRDRSAAKPVEMLEDVLVQGEGTPVHGVWHHALIGEILLVCLRNAGHPITDDLIDEVIDRGRVIPGGSCGFLGTCGALSSTASAYAILLGSTPVAIDQREKLLEFSQKLISRLAEIGGSRCCKKSSYAAIETAVEEFARCGFELPKEECEGRCPFFASNETCDGDACVYFPRKRQAGA
jgi:hypothetical protein